MKKPLVKYVRAARCWCLTYWDKEGKQKQEWHDTEAQANIAAAKHV